MLLVPASPVLYETVTDELIEGQTLFSAIQFVRFRKGIPIISESTWGKEMSRLREAYKEKKKNGFT